MRTGRFIYLICIAAFFALGCDDDKKQEMAIFEPMADAGPVDTDMGVLPFFPKGPPPTPGEELSFAPDRQRCQIIAEHRQVTGNQLLARHVWTYDQFGNLTLDERDENGNGIIDRRLSSRFVAAERPTLITDDRDGDGLPDSIVTLEYAGPEQGTALYDDDADGIVDRREVKRYRGELVIEEAWYDVDADILQSRTVYQYDDSERLILVESFNGDESVARYRSTVEYDELGRLIRSTQDEDADGQIELDVSTQYEDEARRLVTISSRPLDEKTARLVELYDGSNRLMQRTLDISDDGSLEESTQYQYDGEVLVSRESASPDGNRVEQFEYDVDNRIQTTLVDSDPQSDGAERRIDYTHFCRSALDDE